MKEGGGAMLRAADLLAKDICLLNGVAFTSQ
jgi:hypothetical protein